MMLFYTYILTPTLSKPSGNEKMLQIGSPGPRYMAVLVDKTILKHIFEQKEAPDTKYHLVESADAEITGAKNENARIAVNRRLF